MNDKYKAFVRASELLFGTSQRTSCYKSTKLMICWSFDQDQCAVVGVHVDNLAFVLRIFYVAMAFGVHGWKIISINFTFKNFLRVSDSNTRREMKPNLSKNRKADYTGIDGITWNIINFVLKFFNLELFILYQAFKSKQIALNLQLLIHITFPICALSWRTPAQHDRPPWFLLLMVQIGCQIIFCLKFKLDSYAKCPSCFELSIICMFEYLI